MSGVIKTLLCLTLFVAFVAAEPGIRTSASLSQLSKFLNDHAAVPMLTPFTLPDYSYILPSGDAPLFSLRNNTLTKFTWTKVFFTSDAQDVINIQIGPLRGLFKSEVTIGQETESLALSFNKIVVSTTIKLGYNGTHSKPTFDFTSLDVNLTNAVIQITPPSLDQYISYIKQFSNSPILVSLVNSMVQSAINDGDFQVKLAALKTNNVYAQKILAHLNLDLSFSEAVRVQDDRVIVALKGEFYSDVTKKTTCKPYRVHTLKEANKHTMDQYHNADMFDCLLHTVDEIINDVQPFDLNVTTQLSKATFGFTEQGLSPAIAGYVRIENVTGFLDLNVSTPFRFVFVQHDLQYLTAEATHLSNLVILSGPPDIVHRVQNILSQLNEDFPLNRPVIVLNLPLNVPSVVNGLLSYDLGLYEGGAYAFVDLK